MERKVNPRLNIFKRYRYVNALIDPFIFGTTTLPLMPFVAPSNFDATAQAVNIHKIFSEYVNVNKVGGYSFSDTVNTLSLPSVSGVSYRIGYTRGGIDYVFDGTSFSNPFTATIDTKRWVIVNSVTLNGITLPQGAIWGYGSNRCTQLSAVYGNTTIKYLHLESYSAHLPYYVAEPFKLATNLTGILTMPTQVTVIPQQTFASCSSLTSVVLSPNTTEIGAFSFTGCSNITSVTNTNNLLKIGASAFQGCAALTTFAFPSTLQQVEGFAFLSTGLSGNLYLPNLNYIGFLSFSFMPNLTGTLTLSSGNITIIGQPFAATPIQMPDAVGGNWRIENNILYNLDRSYVYGTSSIKSGAVILPTTVTYMYQYAFYYCAAITSIKVQNSNPASITLESNVFTGMNFATTIIYVPSGSLAAYRAAAQWSAFTNIVEY